jgi:hypothetical protein
LGNTFCLAVILHIKKQIRQGQIPEHTRSLWASEFCTWSSRKSCRWWCKHIPSQAPYLCTHALNPVLNNNGPVHLSTEATSGSYVRMKELMD